jgi:hypothetical protein
MPNIIQRRVLYDRPRRGYTRIGSLTNTDPGGATMSRTMDLGAEASDRVILLVGHRQNAGFSSVSVGGQAGSIVVDDPANLTAIWALAGASGGSGLQTVSVTGGIAELRAVEVYRLEGLSSTTPVSTVDVADGASMTLTSVQAGDFLFAVMRENSGPGQVFPGSTQIPSNIYDRGGVGAGQEWTVIADWWVGATPSGGNFVIDWTGVRYVSGAAYR